MLHQFLAQILAFRNPQNQCHVGVNGLALDFVGHSHHGGLRHRRMSHQGRLHFRRAQPVAGNVDHVVHPAGEPVVAVLVAAGAVSGEIVAGILGEVGVEKPLRVALDAAHQPWPGKLDAQVALGRALQPVAGVVHDQRADSRKGPRGRARFEGGASGQGGDEDAAGFRLPPGIHDRQLALPHDPVIPEPRFRVDGLPHRSQQAQGGAFPLLDGGVALPHQGAERRGGGVEDFHLVLVHHVPEPPGVGIVGHALEHQAGGAVGEGAVDDVAVSGDPADVGGAPENVALAIVEHQLVGEGGVHQVPAGGMQHALGLSGGAGGVKDEERVFGVHGLRRTGIGNVRGRHLVVPPPVTPLFPVNGTPGVADDDTGFHRRGFGQGDVGIGLQRYRAGRPQPLVRCDDVIRLAIQDAVAERVGAETAEHHRMHRADPGAGQHGDGKFQDHGQIDGDPVALFDPHFFQHVGEAAYLPVQFAIGQGLADFGVVGLPDQGDGIP